MVNIKNAQTEILWYVTWFLFLWFVLTNVNPNLGNVYLWATGIGFILLILNITVFDKSIRVTLQKERGKHFEAIIAGAVGWVVLLITSFIIFNVVEPAKANFGAIMLSLNAANPAFSQSKIINLITLSFAIGFTETQLFARLLEFFADRMNIPINRTNRFRLGFILLVIGLSILFVVYHLTAKGIESFSSLVIVALMMAISLFMIAYFDGETRQAVWMHIIANGVAGFLLLQSGGILFG